MSRGQPLVNTRSSRAMLGHRRGSSGQAMHEPSNGQVYASSAGHYGAGDDSFNFKGLENGYAPQGTVRHSMNSSSQHSMAQPQHSMPGSVGLNRPLNQAPSIAESQHARSNTPQEQPLMGGATGAEAAQSQANGPQAKAMYSYTANAEDPNEISFTKGEILTIIDNSGKWWQSVAPSLFLFLSSKLTLFILFFSLSLVCKRQTDPAALRQGELILIFLPLCFEPR